MSMTLEQAAAECVAAHPLPDGYRIETDDKTDNLMVYGPTLSFCVTRKAIEDGHIKDYFPPSLEALMSAEATGGALNLPPVHARAL